MVGAHNSKLQHKQTLYKPKVKFKLYLIYTKELYNKKSISIISIIVGSLFKKIFLVGAIAMALFLGNSIMSLICVWVAYTLLSLITTAVVSSRVAGYKVISFVKDITPYFIVALSSAIISLLPYLFFTNSWALLISSTLVFGVSYISIVALFKMEIWLECLSLAKRKLGITK